VFSHVIAGNIITKLGIKYTYIISFGVMFPLVVLIYLFIWETTFTGPRPKPFKKPDLKSDENKSDASSSELSEKVDIQMVEKVETDSLSKEDRENRYGANDPKLTWFQQLTVFRGRITDRSFFKAILQPFPLMIFPAVMFSTIVNGAFITWMVTSGLVTFQVLAYPPYNLQPDTLAYISLPGSFVGLFAAVSAGFLNDWVIKKLAKMNNGVYEPEFRLLAMIPGAMFTTLGFYLMGPAYANHYAVPKIVALGLLFHIGGPFAASACITYIFDSHGHTTTEAFVATSLFKSIFIFFATQFVPKWFERVGAIKCYNTLALLNLGFCSLTIPMYIYGKRLRGIVSASLALIVAR
jgi:Major Facilitator Superfamily